MGSKFTGNPVNRAVELYAALQTHGGLTSDEVKTSDAGVTTTKPGTYSELMSIIRAFTPEQHHRYLVRTEGAH